MDATVTADVRHGGGWLRFDGSRMTEERGGCYLRLGESGLAAEELGRALGERLSRRRRGAVLSDLALAGLQRGDLDQVLHYGYQALTHPENAAEQRSLEKAGFRLEGVLRAFEFRAGGWSDAGSTAGSATIRPPPSTDRTGFTGPPPAR
ncbi:GNAT family protein [Spongiactinospora sp. TRM90649]|uniref:GNAT family N-acetyltransferase n=1 Tax=Spongiactinospora sp. TRM90649 TaxID=3031114 RepID=UPI0023F9A93B|nr:GNAT family protein [Spongiactinospora sp. TRM90649]MDF5753686.1 GNAT family protein [Spongiactinospora sp. TRM90649]